MHERPKYKPYFRINKSVLFLGLTMEDMIPGIIIFLVSQIFFKDLMVGSFLAVFFIISSAVLRRKHRTMIVKDVVISFFTKDVVYVSPNRSGFKFSFRK